MLWLVALAVRVAVSRVTPLLVKPQGSGSQILSNWAILIRVDSRQCFFLNSISSLNS